jgi:hypothetical protein
VNGSLATQLTTEEQRHREPRIEAGIFLAYSAFLCASVVQI